MIRHDPRTWWGRAVWWWSLRGQFSWPVRAVSPSRRAVHREVAAWFAELRSADISQERLARRIWQERMGVDDPLAGLDEAELFRRIFGREPDENEPAR
ncbi:hypothetical protein ACFVSN_31880 [Kitasatospora sp. NPDC057904]|uniref:hypothetical protein n=1 Tax=Kitasatospora sp. NPDC057904 TaxID=3346275 RepID=UPI0036D97208